jgi:hypothetical protein
MKINILLFDGWENQKLTVKDGIIILICFNLIIFFIIIILINSYIFVQLAFNFISLIF